jgi:hypothetical protein
MRIDALSPDEARCLIAYARRKFAEERYPLAPDLREVREVIAELEPKPAPPPAPKPHVPSSLARRKRR